MPNYNAADPNCGLVRCAVCDKFITGGNWFARIQTEVITVALCCPLCADTFERSPADYLRRIEMLSQSGGDETQNF